MLPRPSPEPLLLLLASLLGLGCGNEPGAPRDTADEGFVPDLPVAACGDLDYAWRSTGEVGGLVEYEEADDYTMASEQVDALLPLVDLEGYVPVPYDAQVYRMRYTTQDRGELTEATALVSVPVLDTPGDRPVMLMFHGTTGFEDACAPSSLGMLYASPAIVAAALGAVVVYPDYPGLVGMGENAAEQHALLLVEPSVVASLDAVRAAERLLLEVGAAARPDTTQVTFWGQSEGALFALWAERFGRIYLPEWRPRGVVAVVPPTNLSGLLTASTTTFGRSTGVLVAAAIGQSTWYGEADRLTELFTDAALSEIRLQMDTVCDIPEFGQIQSVEEVFQAEALPGLQAGEAVDPFSCYLEAANLHEATLDGDPDVPLLIVSGEADDLALPELVRQDVLGFCDAGLPVVHRECAGIGHEDTIFQSLAWQVQWAFDRAEGEPLLDATCEIEDPIDCGS